MQNLKRLSLLFIILLFISSCSQKEKIVPKSNVTNDSQAVSSQEDPESTNTPPIENPPGALTKGKLIETRLNYATKADGAEFQLQIKNSLDHPLALHFKTVQRYDYILKSSKGTVIKQLSKEQTNPKLPSEEFLKPKGELLYTETIKDLPKGTYTITFIFMAKEEQSKVTMKFIIN